MPGILMSAYYQQLKTAVTSSNNTNYPNTGILENKDQPNEELTNQLNCPPEKSK